MTAPKRIVLVCAEPSGDMLASRLLAELQAQYPQAEVAGIGGELCQAQGMTSWFDMHELSVMGLVEVLKHLPRLLQIRKQLKQRILAWQPDLYIGVDAPDFNLPVAKFAKSHHIPTLHYVSPTVWAWREKRIHKIKASVDHVLGLFPFEAEVYYKHQLDYTFVGHPMADEVLLQPDQAHARQEVGVTDNHPVVALLPGSRASEIAQMLPLFMQTFATVKAQLPSLQAIIPAVNDARETQIRALCASSEFGDDVLITRTDPRQVMIASDFVLLTSGTATLEAMLCKKPMLSAYKMSALTYWMMKRLYQPKYFSLPNILANEALLPELLQEDVKPQVMADYMMSILTTTPLPHSYTPTVQGSTMTPASAQHICYQQQRFVEIHQQLQRNASQQATKVVIQMLGQAC